MGSQPMLDRSFVLLHLNEASPGTSTHSPWVLLSIPSALFHLSLTLLGLYLRGYAARSSSAVRRVVIIRQLQSNGDLQSQSWR
jgi:hypothetical protein